MKLIEIPLVIALLVLMLSCSKDKDNTESNPVTIQGSWKGAYGLSQQDPSHYYAFQIKDGGAVEEYSSSGEKKAVGTWTLSGEDFSATLTYVSSGSTYKAVAKFNSKAKRLDGTWGYSTPTSGGKWYMTKQ